MVRPIHNQYTSLGRTHCFRQRGKSSCLGTDNLSEARNGAADDTLRKVIRQGFPFSLKDTEDTAMPGVGRKRILAGR
jgi:hypothetical protein